MVIDKKQPELADIFRKYGEDYRRSHFLSAEQSKTMHHIEICRTAVLGGHIEACDHCGYKQITGFYQSRAARSLSIIVTAVMKMKSKSLQSMQMSSFVVSFCTSCHLDL